MNILAADITVIPGLEWEHLQVNKTVWPAGLILLFAEGGDSAVFQVVLHQESRLIPVLEIINFRVLVFSTNIYYAVSLCLAACSVLEILICSVTSGGSNSLWPGELEPTRLLCLWDFPRQEYWSGSLCPPPGDLPNPGNLRLPCLLAFAGEFFTCWAIRGSQRNINSLVTKNSSPQHIPYPETLQIEWWLLGLEHKGCDGYTNVGQWFTESPVPYSWVILLSFSP